MPELLQAYIIASNCNLFAFDLIYLRIIHTTPQMNTTKRLFVQFLRYSPTIGVFCYMIHYALLPFGIRTPMADYVIDLSILSYIFLMVSSHLFGFCLLHRAFITYIFVASMDIDLHHWIIKYAVHPEAMPVFMCSAGLVLFVLLVIQRNRCKNETCTIC